MKRCVPDANGTTFKLIKIPFSDLSSLFPHLATSNSEYQRIGLAVVLDPTPPIPRNNFYHILSVFLVQLLHSHVASSIRVASTTLPLVIIVAVGRSEMELQHANMAFDPSPIDCDEGHEFSLLRREGPLQLRGLIKMEAGVISNYGLKYQQTVSPTSHRLSTLTMVSMMSMPLLIPRKQSFIRPLRPSRDTDL